MRWRLLERPARGFAVTRHQRDGAVPHSIHLRHLCRGARRNSRKGGSGARRLAKPGQCPTHHPPGLVIVTLCQQSSRDLLPASPDPAKILPPFIKRKEAAVNWNAAALRQREALKCIAAALLAMAAGGATLPRHLHRTVLRLLRPAEAAARRLIIALARDLPAAPVRKAGPRRPPERPTILAGGVGTGILMPRGTFALTLPHAPLQKLALPLLDPLPSRAPGGRARRSASAACRAFPCPAAQNAFLSRHGARPRPTIRSMLRVCVSDFRRWRRHSKICRAQPDVSRAGELLLATHRTRRAAATAAMDFAEYGRCGQADRPAGAGSPSIRFMRC